MGFIGAGGMGPLDDNRKKNQKKTSKAFQKAREDYRGVDYRGNDYRGGDYRGGDQT